jgi:hypothetical protein
MLLLYYSLVQGCLVYLCGTGEKDHPPGADKHKKGALSGKDAPFCISERVLRTANHHDSKVRSGHAGSLKVSQHQHYDQKLRRNYQHS